MMNTYKVVKAWQQKILVDCEHILQRQLTDAEMVFVRGRAGFIALELIKGSVSKMNAVGLTAYLNSERDGVRSRADRRGEIVGAMMIKNACAAEIYAVALKSIEDLTHILTISPGRCSDEKYEQLTEGVGRSIAQIQMGILEVLISEFPELDDLPR